MMTRSRSYMQVGAPVESSANGPVRVTRACHPSRSAEVKGRIRPRVCCLATPRVDALNGLCGEDPFGSRDGAVRFCHLPLTGRGRRRPSLHGVEHAAYGSRASHFAPCSGARFGLEFPARRASPFGIACSIMGQMHQASAQAELRSCMHPQ